MFEIIRKNLNIRKKKTRVFIKHNFKVQTDLTVCETTTLDKSFPSRQRHFDPLFFGELFYSVTISGHTDSLSAKPKLYLLRHSEVNLLVCFGSWSWSKVMSWWLDVLLQAFSPALLVLPDLKRRTSFGNFYACFFSRFTFSVDLEDLQDVFGKYELIFGCHCLGK